MHMIKKMLVGTALIVMVGVYAFMALVLLMSIV